MAEVLIVPSADGAYTGEVLAGQTSGAGYVLRAPGVIAVVDQHAVVDQATGDASYELIITALR